jgi:hypothetical protein
MKNTRIRLLVCLVIATLMFSVMAIGAFAEETVVAVSSIGASIISGTAIPDGKVALKRFDSRNSPL